MLLFLEMLAYWILCFVEITSLEKVFMKLINMSISAGWLILAVLLLRIFLKKSPKWVNVLLWGIVAVRLISPINLESTLSLIPSAETVPTDIGMDVTPNVDSGINIVNSVVNPVIESAYSPPVDTVTSANPLQILIPIYAGIWFLGMVVLFIYTVVSYWRLRRKVNMAVLYRDNIFQSENVSSPFVLGIIKPKIYLPFGLEGHALEHVVSHEQAHIQRKDYWWKPIGFLLLTIYWFNPLVWLAYVLLCRDIEIACDEKVIKKLDNGERADYTQALVTCSVKRRSIAACPLAFGEVGVKERVKSVMNYKRPAFWTILISILVCAVVAVCFLTNPKPDTDSAYSQSLGSTEEDDQNVQIPVLEIADLKKGEEYQFRDIPWGSSVEDVKALITSTYDWWEVGKEQYNTTESFLLMGEAVNPIYTFQDDKLVRVNLLYDKKYQKKQFNVLVEELTKVFGPPPYGKDESVTGGWYYSWHTDNSAIQINTSGNDTMIFFLYSKAYEESEVVNGETEKASVTESEREILSTVYDYHNARYKEGTAYAVNKLTLLEQSQTEALVEVEIAKDEVVQVKRHYIRLQLVDGGWEITEVIGNEMVFSMNRIFYMTNKDVSVAVEEDIKTSVIDSPYVGTIQSVIDSVMYPTEELQANFDCEGAEVVSSGSGIAVYLDGKWIEFHPYMWYSLESILQ